MKTTGHNNYFSLRVAVMLLLIIGGVASRVLAQAETLPHGRGVVSVFYLRSETDRQFDFLGQRVRVIPPAGAEFRGLSRTEVLSFDLAYGITNRLEAHVNLPLARTKLSSIGADGKVINNPDQSPSASGLSNVRFGVRYNLVNEKFFLTAKFDVKTPAATPNVEKLFNGTTLPVEEGQTDYDLTGLISRSFSIGDHSLGVGGEAGIRFRRPQQDGALDTFTGKKLPVSPAKEFICNFRVSYGLLPRLSVALVGDGITQGDYNVPFRFTRLGNSGELKTVGTQGTLPAGFKPDFEKQTGRRIFSLGPTLNVTVTPRTVVTGGVLFTAAGRNYPAGRFLVLGVSRFF